MHFVYLSVCAFCVCVCTLCASRLYMHFICVHSFCVHCVCALCLPVCMYALGWVKLEAHCLHILA